MEEEEQERSGIGGGARYKLMSPAKLPISRSSCITIPPGLSPTSFLESPVLLTNIKAEPSPTTGSFFKSRQMQSFSFNANSSAATFEFKPHTSAPLQVSAGFNVQRSEINQNPIEFQSSSVSCKLAQPNEETLTATKYVVDEETNGMEVHHKDSGPADRLSDDGYNWRKYGQKVVKGSEFPRSYYKCTYPNCEVKKIFERSYTGKITEIAYKGAHDHPKPQATRRLNPGALTSILEDNTSKPLSVTGHTVRIQL